MNLFLLNIMLAFAWAVVNGSLAPRDVAVGFVVGYLVLWLVRPALGRPAYHERALQVSRFGAWYLGELVRTNAAVARAVLMPGHGPRPGIVAVPLDCETDVEITAVANLVSLTPGSVTVSVSRDRRTLYVHVMDLELDRLEEFRQEIKQTIERRVLELMRGESRARELLGRGQ